VSHEKSEKSEKKSMFFILETGAVHKEHVSAVNYVQKRKPCLPTTVGLVLSIVSVRDGVN